MAMRGRPRRPVAARVLEGSYRADRHGALSEQWQPDGEPVRPEWLSDKAIELWDEIVPELCDRGIASAVDASELAALCDWWSRYRAASQALNRVTEIGSPEYYRLSILMGMAWKCFASAASKFGLSPSDRARLTIPPQEKSVTTFARDRNEDRRRDETLDSE